MKKAPFKVMCVKKTSGRCAISGEPMEVLEVGDRDIVVAVSQHYGKTVYELERFGSMQLYHESYFATLPEKSAYEIAIEAHEAIIYQR